MSKSDLAHVRFETGEERQAWALGAQRADELLRDSETTNPEQLATEAGIDIVDDEWSSLEQLVILGTHRDSTITLYRTQIRTVASAHDVPELQLVEGTIAHELGHHFVDVSAVTPSHANRWVNVVKSVLGINRHRKPVLEAAANGFCFTLLEARYVSSPLFDSPEVLTAPSQ